MAICVVAAVALAAPAWAQTPPPVPSSARPEVAPEALTPPPPPAAPGLELAPAPAGAPPAGAESVTFALAGLDIDGATVYTADELAPFYADKIGATVSLADVFAVAAAIEAHYRADGYFLTRVVVPAQRIDGGRVRLTVVEGYIKTVSVIGDTGGSRDLVEAMASRVTESGPARLDTVERQLLLINDLPGLTARGTLSPVAGERGASQLTVEVVRKAVDGFAAIDNRGSKFLGPWGLTLGAGMNSFTPLAERLELVVFSSLFNDSLFDDEQRLAQLSGETTLNEDGLRLRAYASYAVGQPGEALSIVDIETEATRFGLSLAYPILRSRRLSLTGAVAFDYMDEDDTALDAPITEDRLRVLRGTLEGEFRDSLAGVTRATLGLHAGLDLFGASKDSDSNLSRADADGSFTKATLEISRLQHLVSFDFGSLDLYLAAAGQLSDGPLLADEEFRLGGYRFGRGYAPGELAGDDALAGTIELQFSGVIDETTEQGRFNLPYQLYAFYDAGQVWNDVASGEANSAALTSAGVGLRLYIDEIALAEVEVAKPLTRDRSDREGEDAGRQPGVFFRLVGSF
jgi:hemolysin activation/secretion protein